MRDSSRERNSACAGFILMRATLGLGAVAIALFFPPPHRAAALQPV